MSLEAAVGCRPVDEFGSSLRLGQPSRVASRSLAARLWSEWPSRTSRSCVGSTKLAILSAMRCSALLLLILAGHSENLLASPAAGPAAVQFAGFAVTGDASGSNSAVIVIAPMLQGDPAIARNRRLLAEVLGMSSVSVDVRSDGLAALDGSTTAIAVAAAIDRETVLVEQIAGRYKFVVEVAGQALFFDFREKQVIASIPVTVQHIDVLDSPPDAAAQAAAIQNLLDAQGENGVVSAMARAIASARLPNASSRRMQLVEVAAPADALQAYPGLDARVRSGIAGHEFSKLFVAGTGLALLPFRSGQAIGGAMAARFADGSVYNLKIPEADYVMRIRLDRVAHKPVEKTAALERRLYGVFFHAIVEEPLSGRRYLDQSLRQGATKLIPSTQSTVDDEAALYDTLLEGFASFAAASQGDADTWVAEQPGGRPSRHEWNELKELIDQCR